MLVRLLMSVLLFVFTAGTAHAEWRVAESRNFIVYSTSDEATLRGTVDQLERFDHMLRRVHNVQSPPSPNKLRIFLFPQISDVQRIFPVPGADVAGYYVPDARGMLFVGTWISRGQGIGAQTILFHEYTHHFMYQYFPAAYPTWYSEGNAEFWGSTRILPGNVVEIGRPAEHRFGSTNLNLGFTNMARWLPVDRLLSALAYSDVPEPDLLYAEGWMLVRYCWENRARQTQLNRYLALVNQGRAPLEAAREAFGDLRQLNGELYEYAGRTRFNVLTLPFREFDIGAVTVRTLAGAEAALLEDEIRLSQGIPNLRFADFATGLRNRAASWPNDPHALRLLAEMERIANRPAEARAAADALLRAAPNDPRGLMLRAQLTADQLRTAQSTDQAAWNGLRADLRRAARARPSDPLILEAFYDSYAAQGVRPPEEAQSALYTAMDLAPNDGRLRHKLASDFESRDMIEEAIAIIRPDAYDSPAHRGESDRARQRRERMEDRYREAGQTRRETPRQMYERLRQRLAERQSGTNAPATAPAQTPAAAPTPTRQ